MPEPLFKVELGKSMADQDVPGHNRWHPDIPAVAATDPGMDFRIECLDWTNGQVGNNDSANDIRDMDLDQNHVLSGPIQINGAEPGDVLIVDILDMGPFPGADTDASVQNYKTQAREPRELRFHAMLIEDSSELELIRA